MRYRKIKTIFYHKEVLIFFWGKFSIFLNIDNHNLFVDSFPHEKPKYCIHFHDKATINIYQWCCWRIIHKTNKGIFNFVFKYIKIFDFILFSSRLIKPNPLKSKCVPSLSKHVSIFFTICCNLECFDYTSIHKSLSTIIDAKTISSII